MVQVECDLVADWITTLRDELRGFILNDVDILSEDEVVDTYFNIHLRYPVAKARTLHLAQDFNIDPQFSSGWSDFDILEKMNNNWPELLADKRMLNGEISNTYNSQDHEALRKLKVNTPIKLSDGHTYIVPGGGFASSGLSFIVKRTGDTIRAELAKKNEEIKNNPLHWINHPLSKPYDGTAPLKAQLAVDGSKFYVQFPKL